MEMSIQTELDRLEKELRQLRALLEWDALYASERRCDRWHGMHKREETQSDIRVACGFFCSRACELQESLTQKPADMPARQYETNRTRLRALMDQFSGLQVIERFIRP